MATSKLTQIAQFAEIIAAVAVIVSLLYVGRQVQDNTAAVRSASAQAVADASDSALIEQVSNPEFSALRRKGDLNFVSLTDEERSRYINFTRGQWIRFQNVYVQYDIGVLDQRMWGTYARIICSMWDISPGLQSSWASHEHVLDPMFVDFIENCPESAANIAN